MSIKAPTAIILCANRHQNGVSGHQNGANGLHQATKC